MDRSLPPLRLRHERPGVTREVARLPAMRMTGDLGHRDLHTRRDPLGQAPLEQLPNDLRTQPARLSEVVDDAVRRAGVVGVDARSRRI